MSQRQPMTSEKWNDDVWRYRYDMLASRGDMDRAFDVACNVYLERAPVIREGARQLRELASELDADDAAVVAKAEAVAFVTGMGMVPLSAALANRGFAELAPPPTAETIERWADERNERYGWEDAVRRSVRHCVKQAVPVIATLDELEDRLRRPRVVLRGAGVFELMSNLYDASSALHRALAVYLELMAYDD